jgi:hypothetical protein
MALTPGQLAEIDQIVERIKASGHNPQYILNVLRGLQDGAAVAGPCTREHLPELYTHNSENH